MWILKNGKNISSLHSILWIQRYIRHYLRKMLPLQERGSSSIGPFLRSIRPFTSIMDKFKSVQTCLKQDQTCLIHAVCWQVLYEDALANWWQSSTLLTISAWGPGTKKGRLILTGCPQKNGLFAMDNIFGNTLYGTKLRAQLTDRWALLWHNFYPLWKQGSIKWCVVVAIGPFGFKYKYQYIFSYYTGIDNTFNEIVH